MDILSILLILLVVVAVVGIAAFAAVQTGLWTTSVLSAAGSMRIRKADRRAVRERAGGDERSPVERSGNGVALADGPDQAVADAEFAPVSRERPTVDWRDELRSALANSERWFGTLQRGFDERSETIVRRLDGLAREVTLERDRSSALAAAAQTRQEAALDRLRSELLVGRERQHVQVWLGERRAEMAAELYLRLARLEAAIAAVTNPILLPGEPYAPPSEFMAEALTWDNWKDVGERAFAFADTYSSRRLYLSDGTSEAVAGFVTTLRGLLTRSIYPNLRPDPTPAQLQALRAALDEVAEELPRLRARLETEFREATGQPGSSEPVA